jgi:hypothetical protein
MHLSKGKRVYLPLVLLFWLFGSVGSFAIGEELHHTPQALSGVTAYISQDLGSLFAAAMGTEVQAVEPERGPVTLTVQPNPPKVTATSAPSTPHTASPAAPYTTAASPKGNQAGGKDDKHGGGGNKGQKGKDGG